ncbi:hypothetical protein LIER_31319 [Lithospermum erythrorhizon]|uniref:Reverse transcriptase RNase H-like domain-containing protein n=1 Tax=Lithospermum erythrorhizon TaxID=34254 RepID=A0AAV3RTT7_LITER
MQPPREYEDIQKLTGCLATLSGFISQSGERNLPFFKHLRRASSTKFYWDDKCIKAFEELTKYLSSPSVLIHEVENQQRSIYYVSCVLHGAEENYQIIDKFVFAMVISARKLKIHFESHPIQVLTDQPMKRVITSPQLSRRLMTWAIELSEFDISYVPRTSIKAQALANFIIKCTAQPPEIINGSSDFEPGTNNPEWVL